MRLLHFTDDEELSLTADMFNDSNIPRYAILSHTWGDEEVHYDDIGNVRGMIKAGYAKILFCARRAAADGLQYCWVDSCCINKSNSSEHSEAINSMFRWYQNAERCYVYLVDVSSDSRDETSDSTGGWELAMRRSRWFTRGWTLQELIAPSYIEFFSKEMDRLGDRKSLEEMLHEITGIPIEVLRTRSLINFGIEQRFSWAAKRQTTYEEDMAYCLLGMFDIHMPLLYGEGKETAMKRLGRMAESATAGPTGVPLQQKLSGLRQWLSVPNPATQPQRVLRSRGQGTCDWVLDSRKYVRWKTSPASILWLYGVPGSGKTMISTTVLEDVLQSCSQRSAGVSAHFYFDFNDAQTQGPDTMLRSLICQLSQNCARMPPSLDTLFAMRDSRQDLPSLQTLLEALKQMMLEFPQVFILIEALDECTQRRELMDVLDIVAWWQLDNVHLLMTSRKERDIESSLESYVKEENTICLQSAVDKDIQRYVQQRLGDDKGLAKWNKDAAVRQEIEAALMRGAHGMFRWAVCQLDTLAKCRNRAMLRKSLATLPQMLDQTYDRILTAISEEDCDYAMRILQWLTFSARPLLVEEIAEVVAIDVARDPAFDRDEMLEDPLEALDICSNLVTIIPNSTQRIIALAHYSIQEYLVSDRIKQGQAKQYSMQEAKCHSAILKSCLVYLLQLQQPLSEETLKASALARYAAEFWSSHLQNVGEEADEVTPVVMSFMSMDNPAYLTWIQLCDPDHPYRKPDLGKSLECVATPLYYAALLGLSTITRLLLYQGADVNAQGGEYGNALYAASVEGHEQVVKMLLDKGADVNAQGGEYGNALYAASVEGHEKVVRMLRDAGAHQPEEDGTVARLK
ncbi:HET-domain-containing protein [Didymella exigua CBS 183.55]|uniref:HET-domain-containing protein n=1 Tax=Didymella exigua CBS 183.55 TaxID=1150837 RepID=A0A6A5RJS5_9PLEO|nr:HET-domain-containing protein [Didymella exigua CBS 183.55]KAF1925827.1 HET-domain-containing protein [Didymella exigua CBS 183.55]